MYGVSFLGLIYLAGLVFYVLYIPSSSGPSYGTSFSWIWIIFTFILFIAIRTQLSSLPVMVTMTDFESTRWPSTRSTPITNMEIFLAVLKHSVFAGVIRLVIMVFLECLAFGVLIAHDVQEAVLFEFVNVALVLINLIWVGFILSALSYIGGLLIRRPFGAVVGSLTPLFILLLTGFSFYALGLSIDTFFTFPEYFLDILILLVIPEAILMWMFLDGELYGLSETLSPTAIIITLGIISTFLWLILWKVLAWRRGR